LAGEMNDRGLAVGTGHRRDRPRLSAMEAGRETCQPTVWVWIDEDRYALARGWGECQRLGIVGQDCDGAVRHGIGGECPAVLTGSGQSGKEKAGTNRPRIGAQTRDLQIEAR